MKTIVTIPTYNEIANVPLLLDALLDLGVEGLECLVIDDDSPDGTARAVEEVAHRRPGVHLIVRKGQRGRGSAGIAAFKEALARGATTVVEMDADFSHDPRSVPALLAPIQAGKADLVLGSRFVPGGQDADRGFHRRLISWAARHYVRLVLGVPIQDVTSGFRAFSAPVLAAIDLDHCRSSGPSILEELLFRAHRKGYRLCEVPIVFKDRTRGQSTLTLSILFETLLFVAALRRRGW